MLLLLLIASYVAFTLIVVTTIFYSLFSARVHQTIRRVSLNIWALMLLGVLVSACTQQQVTTALATPTGQLFCAVETVSGPEVVALTSAAGAGAIIATGAAQAVVASDCAAATASIAGATGPATPISPPASTTPVTTVAVTPAA